MLHGTPNRLFMLWHATLLSAITSGSGMRLSLSSSPHSQPRRHLCLLAGSRLDVKVACNMLPPKVHV